MNEFGRRSYFELHSNGVSGRLDELIALQRGVIGSSLHLVASACYPFDSVLRALGEPASVLPAEGMPGHRYLPGAVVMDLVETEGEALTLELFGNPDGYRATLQPHSGTQANQIVYNAVLEPDDVVMNLRPKDGGHISHTVLLGRRHTTIDYGLTAAGVVDYDRMRELALEYRPKLIIVGGSALPRAIDFRVCAEIAAEVGALVHADISHTATFVAAGLHPSTFPFCDFVTFNTGKNLRGPNSGVLVYRSDFRPQVEASIFPTTQGGANENGMLGKLACLLEWQEGDIGAYAISIVACSRVLGEALAQEIPLVTGGSDCHMLLLDLSDQQMSGADAEHLLESLGVLANRNLVPGDSRGPARTSGLRIGTANLAILGYERADLEALGVWLAGALVHGAATRTTVDALVEKYQGHLVAPIW